MPLLKNLTMNELKNLIHKKILESLSELSFPIKTFTITPSKNENFGDLSTNISLVIAKDLKKNPMDIGKNIIDNFSKELPVFISQTSITKPVKIKIGASVILWKLNISGLKLVSSPVSPPDINIKPAIINAKPTNIIW